MNSDPLADFRHAFEPARQVSDWTTQVDAAVTLTSRTARAVLQRIDLPAPKVASVVHLVAFVKEQVPARLDRLDMSRQPIPPTTALTSLYRAIWWLAKSEAGARASGALAEGAPYNGFDHLMRCIPGDCYQLLVTCPPAERFVPAYATASQVGPLSTATIVDFELAEDIDDAAGAWWEPAQSLVRVEEWEVDDVVLDEGSEWIDIVQLPDVEIEVYSTPFRDAV